MEISAQSPSNNPKVVIIGGGFGGIVRRQSAGQSAG